MALQLPTDSELVDIAAATYAVGAVPLIKSFDGAMQVFVTTRADGLIQIAIEGTHDPIGWAFDFCAWPIIRHVGVTTEELGFVHLGFAALGDSVYADVRRVASKGPFSICGHSLGAAEALYLGARLINDGFPPVKIGAFAPPRVGGSFFAAIATSVPFCAFEYGNDPVPRVPFRITPPLPLPQFPYVQVPVKNIGKPEIDEFACHHIAHYVDAVHALAQQPGPGMA